MGNMFKYWTSPVVRVMHAALVLLIWGGFGVPIRAQVPQTATSAGQDVWSTAQSQGTVDIVGLGDTLSISVLGQPQLNTQATIGADGSIVAPFLGTIPVNGLTPAEIGVRIAEGLRTGGYLLNPQVSVEVLRVRSRMVSILGEVWRPGRYVLEPKLTLWDLLAQAGGLKDSADDRITMLREDSSGQAQQQRIALFAGDSAEPVPGIQTIQLQPGDVIYVAAAQRVFVYGEVMRGGAYPMERGLNVMRVLSLAGGITPRGSERRITIHRTDHSSGQVVQLRAKLSDSLQPGDVIRVDERIF